MGSTRQLLSILALFGCSSWSCGGVVEENSRPSVTSSTGGAAALDKTSVDGGSEALGGTPVVSESVCEIGDDPRLLTEVMIPRDECEGQPDILPPTSPGDCVFWTGHGYLTAFSDSRGIVVASLDEEGVILMEEILSTQPVERLQARFSRNGDRVLIVLFQGVAVLDLRGVPLTELKPLAGDDFAVTPSEDGWLVAFGYHHSTFESGGIILSRISGDGVVRKQHDVEVTWGYVILHGFVPSDDEDAVLRGVFDTGGQFGYLRSFAVVVDHELEAVSCTVTG